MQWLAEVCVRRPIFAVMLILSLVVAGTASYMKLGIDRFPNMDLPTVYVRTAYPGAAPEECESEVSQVLEDAVATVAGIDELRSISSEGSSMLLLTFDIDRDIDAAAQDVRDAVNSVLNRLPVGIDPPVIRKQDTDSSPIMTLAVAGPRDSRELYILAERAVKNVIESARGVGEVQIGGAADRAVQVNIEARRLAAYQLSIMQVREALERQNAEIPGGRVDTGARELSLRTLGRFAHARGFPDLVVATVNGAPVRLRDLGEVVDGSKEVRTFARLDGKSAVVLQVQRQSGANTVEVIEAVKERLARSRELLPEGVTVTVIQDQSRYIHAAMHEIQNHLITGSILASAVVLLFMRSWRSTFIAAIAIPASSVATFAAMKALNFTLNNVTMLALVLMVGVVIDDAIVVLENVFHLIEEKQVPPMQAAVEGTREIGLAVLATTLSLVIVFLPVSFLSSVTGRMLFQFGMTATVAILVSMLISFSLTPTMCSRMLRPARSKDGAPSSRRGFYHVIEVCYMACLRWSLRFRWLVALISLGVIASNVPLYHLVKQDYIPTNVDESEFEVSVTAPEGTSLAAMDKTMRAVEDEIRSVPGVQHALTTIGTRGLARVNSADVYVRLDDIEGRALSLGRLVRETLRGQPRRAFEGNYSQQDKMKEIRSRLTKFRELRCGVRNLTSLRQGAPVDIDFVITGPGLEALADYSEQLRAKAAKIPGIVDVDTTLRLGRKRRQSSEDAQLTSAKTRNGDSTTDKQEEVPRGKPQLLVEIDRERAATLGVDVQEIADTLRIAVGGDDRVSRYRDANVDDAYDVELRLVGIDRSNEAAISQLYVRARPSLAAQVRGGAASKGRAEQAAPFLTRLDNVVRFQVDESAARIDRLDRQRMAAVRANVAPGYALADRIAALRDASAELGMPSAFSTRVMGRGRELERTFQDFGWTFLLSFIFMYIILAAQYEHLVHPLTILFSLPLAVPFGLVSLWLGGETLNLYSALGILVLFGVVKKASILQVDHTNQLRKRGLDRHSAILQANRDRLRPILMTTVAFVAGMLPLLIGTGPGAEERRSIAVLAVGGQTLSLLLTLVAVPVVYSILDDVAALFVRRRATEPSRALSIREPIGERLEPVALPVVTTAVEAYRSGHVR
ncbi:MAG: efflux RND transporter permease subunit [Planctomycetes bacterium]|nr:efflux RND transporter permease subunit [Planctomycetota bacterium]